MQEFKSFLTSKTIWGAIIAGASIVAAKLGYGLGSAEGWVNDLVALAGLGLSIFGRVKAVKKIGM